MKIGIAADHRGYKLKKRLIRYLKAKYEVIDYGTDSEESVDYVDYAVLLCCGVKNKNVDLGILVCGTGIGMSIAANKIKGIMCAKVDNEEESFYAKTHNNANVISISSKKKLYEAKDIVDMFIKTGFLNMEKYQNRIEKIKLLEENSSK